jgi:hypothetical protein
MEGVLAAFAQFDNDCRSDRTRAGMKAVLELGRWTFLAPIGCVALRRSGAAAFAWLAEPKLVRRQDRPAFAASPLRRGSLRVACRAEA